MGSETKSHRLIRGLLLVVLVDLALTLPFVFRDAAEGDTLRYALGLDGWLAGRSPFPSLFNVEMSFGYYLGLAGYEFLQPVSLRELPRFLNEVSLFFGIVAAGTLFLWWRRWWGEPVALRLVLLFIFTPAFWSLHLYGNPNIVGLALAAGCFAALPEASDRSPGRPLRTLLALVLGIAALSVRTDVLMLAPALLAFLVWGTNRPGWRVTVGTLLGSVVGYLVLRAWVLELPLRGGSVAHHWRSNVSLGDTAWLVRIALENLASLASTGPPLVLLASAIVFFVLRRRAGNVVRWTVLLWILPGAIFLVFGRVHLSRILLPLLPALLLPLAFWAAEKGGRRDVGLAGLVVVAHLVMAFVPAVQNRVSDRDPETRRTNHYLFRDFMIRQHVAIERNAAENLADADSLLARAEREGKAFVVIGDEVIFHEFVLQAAHPAMAVRTIGQEYQFRLREASFPGRTEPWYLLSPRWGKDPEPRLLHYGVGADVERHWMPQTLRLRGGGR